MRVRADEAWRGGVLRLPIWVSEPETRAYRPRVGAFMSLAVDLMVATAPAPAPASEDRAVLAIEAFLELARGDGAEAYLPGRVEVDDAELARSLVALLDGTGVTVRTVEDLAPLDELVLESLGLDEPDDRRPGALSGQGVSIDGLRRFVDAACAMARSAPWSRLTDRVPFEVSFSCERRTEPLEELSCVVVMGAAGIDRGLFFFPSAAAHQAIRAAGDRAAGLAETASCWFVSFVERVMLPADDADLWEDEGLASVRDADGLIDACPVALRVDEFGEIERPDAVRLAGIEAVARTLAQATERELDEGLVEASVETAAGVLRVTLRARDGVGACRGSEATEVCPR